ncbi:MAG: DUF456 domain-containing protein [Treponema sp.]|jgi:uncharacterized protein YqgC (DUF456 family)|nr:DUF456 domain-containing protein [Treponema sp.]
MEIVLVILAFVLLVAGILGAFLPMLPGPPLSFIGLLLMKWSGYGNFSPAFLWVWAGITVAVTVMDYFLPSVMAKRFGGSRAAAVGSFLGLLAGIFLFPPWGMIIGPFLGAFAGELVHNRTNGGKALKVAFGAFLAFIVGTGAKLIASSIMLFYAIKVMFMYNVP